MRRVCPYVTKTCRAARRRVGVEMLGSDLVWCPAGQHPLAPGIVGSVEATQQLFERPVRVDVDAEDLAADPAVETLDHTVGLGCAGAGVPIVCTQLRADLCEGGREATAVVGQHVGELERERGCCLTQE